MSESASTIIILVIALIGLATLLLAIMLLLQPRGRHRAPRRRFIHRRTFTDLTDEDDLPDFEAIFAPPRRDRS